MSFTFGQNWLRFSHLIDDRRLCEAEASLQQFTGEDLLKGRSFVDIGAGSGLFSIAAVRLGASPVVALDRDDQCLFAIRQNAQRFLNPEQASHLHIQYGDVLRPESLGNAHVDVVYAWGSLHHTGAMWHAIANAAQLCRPGGHFILAIYNRTPLSPVWLLAKRFYAAAPPAVGSAMAAALFATRVAARLAKGRHPLQSDRGMSIWYDAVDWLGGLPYECATADELTGFVQRLGFTCVHATLTRRSGCNEFAFQKRPS